MRETTIDLSDNGAVAELFSRWVSGASQEDFDDVSFRLCSDHRTLQQLFANFLMLHLGNLAGNSTDARNELAVKAAKAGYAAMTETLNGATRFPLI